jgi:hypothetical protein
LKILLRWPFGADFCASGARVLEYAARRFSKSTPTDSAERILNGLRCGLLKGNVREKKGGTEVPPSLGRKRPRKQQSKLMLQCIIYVRHADLGKCNFAVQHCYLRSEIGCMTAALVLQKSSHSVKRNQ